MEACLCLGNGAYGLAGERGMVTQQDKSSPSATMWFWQFVLRSGSKSPGGYWPPGSAGSHGQARAVEGDYSLLSSGMVRRTCGLKRNFKVAKINQYWTTKTIFHFLTLFFSFCTCQLMTRSNPSCRGPPLWGSWPTLYWVTLPRLFN